MRLMIVESPAKCKKIQSYLGDGWKVIASVGHIRDLPAKSLGVDESYRPQYEITKKDIVSRIKSEVAKASEVWLATDPDREGESISWHIAMAASLKNPKRVTFNEITKTCIQAAVNSPRTIDYALVGAQEARRVIDRLVGYRVSPVLCNAMNDKASAGRVQSPALYLCYERHEAISTFVSRPYYGAIATLDNGVILKFVVTSLAEDGEHIFNRSLIQDLANTTSLVIERIDSDSKRIKPKPPFTTSTLQQTASTLLGMSPEVTMKTAQRLYESGAITYLRTDSPNISVDGFTAICRHLSSSGIAVREHNLKFEAKDGSQEAHECIRPTDPALETAGDGGNDSRLYALIRERALLACCDDGVNDVVKVLATDEDGNEFTASGSIVRSLGWREFAKIEKPNVKDRILPSMEQGERYGCVVDIIESQTKPPAYYTEASLIKELEGYGIGRPSTYASIMVNIISKGYISLKKVENNSKSMAIDITTKGVQVVEMLKGRFSFMSYKYTSDLEDYLDSIARGQKKYVECVSETDAQLTADINSFCSEFSVSANGRNSETKVAPCPLCGESLKQLYSKKNKSSFWIHEQDGHQCEQYLSDDNGAPQKLAKINKSFATAQCPRCDAEIKRLKNPKDGNFFWVHSSVKHKCSKYIKDREVDFK